MDIFLLNSFMVGIGLVCMMSPLGCVVLWKRLAYFGDAIAHAALLGVVVGLLYVKYMNLFIIGVSILFALVLFFMRNERANEPLIIIFSYGFLALGLVLLTVIPHNNQVDIFSYLFGDILLISGRDILFVAVCAIVVLTWLYFRWRQLLLISVSEDIAIVEGVRTKQINLEFMIILAIVIAMSVSMVGILLIVALLVIPASSARNVSNSPISMLVLAILFGVVALIGGMSASYYFDISTGPSIILSGVIIFVLSFIGKTLRQRINLY